MIYLKNKKISLAILLSMFFGFFLGFNNGNASAVSDLTTVINSSDMSSFVNQPIFSSCNDSACLSQYHYLTVSVSSNPYTRNSFWVLKGFRGLSNLSVNVDSVNLIDGSSSLVIGSYDNIYNFSADQFTFTLSESFPTGYCPDPPSGSLTIDENGTFDVTNYASISVDVPQTVTEIIDDPISNDFQKVFFEIVKNIIPAFGILLVVWFGIDMLSSLIFGRGR